MSRDEKQAKKPANNNNLNIRALPAMHNGRHIRKIISSAPPAMPWGMPPSLHSTLGPELKPQMPNPFFGGAQLPPGLGSLAAGMMGQPLNQQNTQMGNPFFGPMMGPRMPMKGGGFGPGYDPWSSLQIHPKVAEKLEDGPVGLFG